MGANSPEVSPLTMHYTAHLRREMEEVDGKQLTTPQGHQITFRMMLIPFHQVDKVKTLFQDYFKANVLFLNGVNPTVWTLG